MGYPKRSQGIPENPFNMIANDDKRHEADDATEIPNTPRLHGTGQGVVLPGSLVKIGNYALQANKCMKQAPKKFVQS